MDENDSGLSAALANLVGEPSWQPLAGKGTGSNFTLAFGRKQLRQHKLTNPTLSEEARRYQGEYSLYVECPWRIQSTNEVVTSWQDAWTNLDVMLEGLQRLSACRVTHAEVELPAGDLVLQFDNGLALSVFCDETASTEYECYTLVDARYCYAVRAGTVERSLRSGL